MKITEVNGKTVKIAKTSITVKNDDGKTCGVVTNCKVFQNMPPRDRFVLAKAGLSPEEATNCVICDNEIYYLHNNRLEKWLNEQKYPKAEIFDEEWAKVAARKATAEKMKERGFNVIDCVIEGV